MERSQIKQHLADPEFFAENRLRPVSDHMWYETEKEALKKENMRLRMSLGGAWKFFYAPNPDSVPDGFERKDYSCDGWNTISVPAHMELQGYGRPHYTDTDYPWDGIEEVTPHGIPQIYNPTGCYVRYFSIPEQMKKKKLLLTFEGVETAFHCWINGHYVGYGEDSYTPSVFEITPFVENGENKIAVEVSRFSSGSWLEDQDFWRMGGIMRDVSVTAVPGLHIRDLEVTACLDEKMTEGKLKVRFDLEGDPAVLKSRKGKIIWKLLDGKIRMEHTVSEETEKIMSGELLIDREDIQMTVCVPDVKLWSAERPYLYRLVFTVYGEEGEIYESVPQDVGFRKVEIRDSVLLFNGRRLRLYGVNRHEFSARKGRAIGKEEMEWDIRFLKRNHFNAVRTSHYPNQSYWYELCDRFGIYVMDETNLETHGTWHLKQFNHTLPGDNPRWHEAVMSRARAMLERDKNHPCIFSWSVGNESWSGKNLYEMSMYFRKRDDSRPVHYENVCHDRRWGRTTDFESRMYASPEEAEAYLKDHPEKPYLLCEYSHAMGNSCGNLREYMELFDKYPQYSGGFLWDYIDQALYQTGPNGKEYLAYGGDFGDRPTNYNFCGNGVIFADRTISPKMQEVSYLYQPYKLTPSETGVTIRSLQLFENGEYYRIVWRLEKEGRVLKSGEAPLVIEPESTVFVEADLSIPEKAEAGEYVRTAALVMERDTPYVKRGEEICFGQTTEQKEEKGKREENKHPLLRTVDGDSSFSVVGADFRITFQKATGKLVSWKIGEKELVYDPVHTLSPEFWRAPTDNDEGYRMTEKCHFWKMESLYPKVKEVTCGTIDHHAVIDTIYTLGETAQCRLRIQIDGEGNMDVTESYTGMENLPDLPCFGVSWKLPKAFSHITWYGKGPQETYRDRQAGGRLGRFETTSALSCTPYLIPQECGNHVETRWVTLTDSSDTGIRVESAVPFEFSVLPYTCHELEGARHWFELPKPYASVLRILEQQTGVGGDNSWGAWAHKPYRLSGEETRTFSFSIRMLQNGRTA